MVQQSPTLLIVEKDEATRELYQRELGRTYAVVATGSASEAIQIVRTRNIAAVILEPAISGDAGWSLISSIRIMARRAPVPVVVCSALDERRRGLELGAAAYLVKPVLPVTLLNILNQVLQG